MIYVFSFDTHFKIGYAATCPWRRLSAGFWHNVHPLELCGKLDQATLLFLFDGDEKLEQAMHAALHPCVGELYPMERLGSVMDFLRRVLEPLPITDRPRLHDRPPRKRPCCGADNGGYQRDDHHRRALACNGKTSECEKCKRPISIRNDHQANHVKRCKGKAQASA